MIGAKGKRKLASYSESRVKTNLELSPKGIILIEIKPD